MGALQSLFAVEYGEADKPLLSLRRLVLPTIDAISMVVTELVSHKPMDGLVEGVGVVEHVLVHGRHRALVQPPSEELFLAAHRLY